MLEPEFVYLTMVGCYAMPVVVVDKEVFQKPVSDKSVSRPGLYPYKPILVVA